MSKGGTGGYSYSVPICRVTRCVVCGDTGMVLGSFPERSTSAPLILIPCQKCKNWPRSK